MCLSFLPAFAFLISSKKLERPEATFDFSIDVLVDPEFELCKWCHV